MIIYTAKQLTRKEETALRRYAETIVVKDVNSPERLLDETTLFLHRVESRLPAEKRKLLQQLHSADAVFEGKKVLIVDDDVRNVFALSNVLEARRMDVRYAENGLDALKLLAWFRQHGFDLAHEVAAAASLAKKEAKKISGNALFLDLRDQPTCRYE